MNIYKRVAIVCKNIPYGKVATYGQIAFLCGKIRNARQVGYALRQGACGTDSTAHRVVNAQGYLSGADSFPTINTQRQLLQAEGITVNTEQKVDLKKYGWHPDQEIILQIQAQFNSYNI